MAQCPAGAMGTGVSPGNPEDGTWLLIPGSGAVHLQAPKLHREGSVPSVPPTPDWEGLTNLPPWNKSTISLWVRVSTERSGMAPGSSSSGGGGVPKATRCGRGSRPERAGGGGKGAGMGRSGLGHGVLVEVRRYESIKNHFLPNSCRERGEERSGRSALPSPLKASRGFPSLPPVSVVPVPVSVPVPMPLVLPAPLLEIILVPIVAVEQIPVPPAALAGPAGRALPGSVSFPLGKEETKPKE